MFLVVAGALPNAWSLARTIVILRVVEVRPLVRMSGNRTAAGIDVIAAVVLVLARIVNFVAAIVIAAPVLVVLVIAPVAAVLLVVVIVVTVRSFVAGVAVLVAVRTV